MTKTAKAGRWKNRIVGTGAEDPAKIIANPKNWRIHPESQAEGLKTVLDRVGWVQNAVINRRTGFLVDGHLRVAKALEAGEPSVPVVYVDLSADEESLILAVLDPVAGLATADTPALRKLLGGIPKDAAVENLLASLRFDLGELPGVRAPVAPEPERAAPSAPESFQYALTFDDQMQQARWFDFLKWLKAKYPEADSEGERLMNFLDAEVLA